MKNTFDDLTDLLTSNLKQISKLQNTIEEQETLHKKEFIDICRGVIEVIDTFERAEERIEEKGLNQLESNIKVARVFNGVHKKLIMLLSRYGVNKIDFPENKLLPSYCNVVETLPDTNKDNDTIISITRNGYTRGKELIREAEVIIVKN